MYITTQDCCLMSYVMFSRILSCFHFFHVPFIFCLFFATFLIYLSHILQETKMLLDLLLPLTKYSGFHLWKYCMSLVYFLQCCHSRYNSWWAVSCWAVSSQTVSSEELCTLLPHSPSPKITFFKSITSLNLFPWFSVGILLLGFKSLKPCFISYAFCTLVTLVSFLTLGCSLFLCL